MIFIFVPFPARHKIKFNKVFSLIFLSIHLFNKQKRKYPTMVMGILILRYLGGLLEKVGYSLLFPL